ncbi:hypothetical protein ERJ75_000047600 [Trypanosoma vivax]|nr:hypothetical protein ERJ75_000047600 [Trypanosoma vivax]
MRRWLASLIGSQKARSSPGKNELRSRHGIGFRRRGKKTALQSSLAGCAARSRERGNQQQWKKRCGFSEQAAALGNATPAPKTPKVYANSVAKRMRTGSAWEQRMPVIRRLGEFAKAHGPKMLEWNAPLFSVSLKLAKGSAVQCTRALPWPMAAGKAPGQAFLSHLRRAAAENPTRQAWPMMRWGPALVCAAMGSERGRVAARLAWVTASCCGEISFLLKENFAERPSDRNTLIVDWGALPKTFEADMRRAERYVAIAGADAVTVGRVIAKVAGGERLATLGMGAVEKALRPCSATAHSIKRGAPAHAPAVVVERDLDPRILTQLWKHAGPLGLPRGTARCPGHWAAVWNGSAKLTALMKRVRGAWPSCLGRSQRQWAKIRGQGRFLMGAAFWDALGLREWPARRNSGDWRCRRRTWGRCRWGV